VITALQLEKRFEEEKQEEGKKTKRNKQEGLKK